MSDDATNTESKAVDTALPGAWFAFIGAVAMFMLGIGFSAQTWQAGTILVVCAFFVLIAMLVATLVHVAKLLAQEKSAQ